MPWNQPINNSIEKKKRSHFFFWIIGVSVIASLVMFYISNDNNTPWQKEEHKKITSKKRDIENIKPPKKDHSFNTISNKPNGNGNVKTKTPISNKVSQANSPWANKPMRVIKMRAADIKPRRFVYDAEEDIATLLEVEPGTSIFGDLPYTHFNKKFQQAIMQRVKINDDDDEYTKELKRQVQAVKDDLKKIMLEGGDVGEEMRKARNELKELGRYRDSLIREINSLRKSGNYSSQDMKDFELAANKILTEKGLKPIKVPAVLLRNMELKERKTK